MQSLKDALKFLSKNIGYELMFDSHKILTFNGLLNIEMDQLLITYCYIPVGLKNVIP